MRAWGGTVLQLVAMQPKTSCRSFVIAPKGVPTARAWHYEDPAAGEW